MSKLSALDARFLRIAYDEAEAGFNEGGCPIGSVLAEGERLIARDATSGYSRVTLSPTARWIACARPAGRGPTVA